MITPVTNSASDSFAPYWDPQGRYLYFFSNRDFNEVIGVFDVSFANPKAGRVYIATLKADEPSPLPVLSDEPAMRKRGCFAAGTRASLGSSAGNRRRPPR